MTTLFAGSTTPADAIARALADGGIEFVLGIPGGNVHVVFDALYDYRDRIRTVLVREESAGSIMAAAYGKQTGRPAAVLAQGAWVLSNCVMGMLEALTSSTPMIVVTDLSDGGVLSHHSVYQSGTGEYGNWDAKRALDGLTKLTTVALTPAQAVQHVQLAIKHSLSGQPGPVAVVLHSQALAGTVAADALPRLHPTGGYLQIDRRPAAPGLVRAAADALAAATRPVIVAGNGIRPSRASEALVELAEAASAPVVTTNAGKGVFPERHPLALGVMGSFGLEAANGEVAAADVVVAVGTSFGAVDTCGENPDLIDPERQTVFQIEIEPRNAAWTYPGVKALHGDARATLRELTAALGDRRADAGASLEPAHARGSFDTADTLSDAVPVLPQRVVHELWSRLPVTAVVTCDAGENRLFMAHHYRTGAVNGFVQPGGIGGMGFAIPAALGSKLAEPDRLAVAVCGDGGFAMSMLGLMTSIEERLPIAVIVMNNRMLGWTRHSQGDRPIASELHAFDHASIARGIGCKGLSVSRAEELAAAIDEIVAEPEVTTVVDVRVSPEESYLKTRSSFARDWVSLVR